MTRPTGSSLSKGPDTQSVYQRAYSLALFQDGAVLLHRMVYASRPTEALDAANMDAFIGPIRAASLRNNAANDISGVLAYTGRWFLQALEGPAPAVIATFDRIAGNSGHSGIHTLVSGPVSHRMFPDWALAVAPADEGFDPFSAPPATALRFLIEAAQRCNGVRSIPGRGPQLGRRV